MLGLMATMLLSGLVTGRRAWERIETRASAGEQVSAAQGRIRGLVERLFPQGELRGSHPTVYFEGDAAGVRFQSAAPDAAQPSPPWIYRLALAASGDVVVDIFDPLARNPARPRERQTLLHGARSLEIGYYGAAAGNGWPRWQTRWAQAASLPQMIRIRIGFAPGDRRIWPELIVHPVATLDSFCVVNAGTGRCRGR